MRITQAVQHLSSDPILARVITSHGELTLPPPTGHFESLAGSIVSQQLSVKSAAAIWNRLVGLLDRDIRPGVLLAQSTEDLRGIGLSRPKIEYLRALAESFIQDPGQYENLADLPDEEVIADLTRIKGIGVWTAHMFLIFTLLREDIFPIGDLGVRRAMERLYFDGASPSPSVLVDLAEPWRPYRSVASLYLWKSID